ncbi:MAG TPA: hypothetical protein VD833_08800 [Vicinamibacterales bacterium]|nr:hypothetical protein [Vicinamibacterales bacterium]
MRRHAVVLGLAAILAAPLAAEEPQPPAQVTPAPAPADRPPPASRPERGQPLNVRIELTITDQVGPGEPSRKVVTVLVADGHETSIRTSGWIMAPGRDRRDVAINVDASPTILKDNVIRLNLGLQYQPTGTGFVRAASEPAPAEPGDAGSQRPAAADGTLSQTMLNERIVTILENGKPLVISQAADPVSDRRMTVEAKATIQR